MGRADSCCRRDALCREVYFAYHELLYERAPLRSHREISADLPETRFSLPLQGVISTWLRPSSATLICELTYNVCRYREATRKVNGKRGRSENMRKRHASEKMSATILFQRDIALRKYIFRESLHGHVQARIKEGERMGNLSDAINIKLTRLIGDMITIH